MVNLYFFNYYNDFRNTERPGSFRIIREFLGRIGSFTGGDAR